MRKSESESERESERVRERERERFWLHGGGGPHSVWADRGGVAQGVRTPLFGHDISFLTLGPKLDPLLDPPFFFAWRPKMAPPPFQKSWIRPCSGTFRRSNSYGHLDRVEDQGTFGPPARNSVGHIDGKLADTFTFSHTLGIKDVIIIGHAASYFL